MLKNKLLVILICLICNSCTFTKVSKGVYTDINWKELNYDNYFQLHFATTNNFSGHFSASKEVVSYSDRSFNDSINVGGLAILNSYFDILSKRYGDGLVLLDGGNFFQTKKEETLNWAKIQSSLGALEKMPYDAILFTQDDLHLFAKSPNDFKHPSIKNKFVSTNIFSLGGGQKKYIDQVQNYKIISRGPLKIAILGLNTYSPNSPITTGHIIEDPVLSYLKLKETIKKQKADLIIVLLNIESTCETNKTGTHCLQKENDHLQKLINRFPPNEIDLIVLNGKKELHDFILDIPVLQNPGEGKFLNRVSLYYDLNNKKLNHEKTIFHKQVKLCEQFYISTGDCDTSSEKEKKRMIKDDSFRTIPAKFLGHDVKVSEDATISY